MLFREFSVRTMGIVITAGLVQNNIVAKIISCLDKYMISAGEQ